MPMNTDIPMDTKSRKIKDSLSHPVVDTDGHTVEHFPAFQDYLKQVGGAELAGRIVSSIQKNGSVRWYQSSVEERRDQQMSRPVLPTRSGATTVRCLVR